MTQRPENAATRRFTTSHRHVGIFPARPIGAYNTVRGLEPGTDWSADPEYAYPRTLPGRMQPEVRELGPHDHEFCELTLVYHGTAVHRTTGYTRTARRNTAIFVPMGCAHAYADYRQWHVTNLSYLPEWLLDNLRTVRREERLLPWFVAPNLFPAGVGAAVLHLELPDGVMTACIAELDSLGRELREPAPSQMVLKACLQKLLVWIARAAVEQEFGRGLLEFRPEIWAAIDAAEQAVLAGQPFAVAETAKAVGLSEAHFSRLFREAVGRSPQDYYQQRRLQQACKLLLSPEWSITAIAHELGFSSSAHFTNRFRRTLGLSPRDYRKRHILAHG